MPRAHGHIFAPSKSAYPPSLAIIHRNGSWRDARHLTSQHSSLHKKATVPEGLSLFKPTTHEMPESRVCGADVERNETPEG